LDGFTADIPRRYQLSGIGTIAPPAMLDVSKIRHRQNIRVGAFATPTAPIDPVCHLENLTPGFVERLEETLLSRIHTWTKPLERLGIDEE
jgi:hypothetical protein